MSEDEEEKLNAHILLVDDSRDNVFLMTKILESFECTYDVAYNGEQALKKVVERPFDFILMDMYMPVMDGMMATRLIRSWEDSNGRKRSVILGVTGMIPQGGEAAFTEAGMDGYITKPFRIDDLQRKLIELRRA